VHPELGVLSADLNVLVRDCPARIFGRLPGPAACQVN
jgi:hypothetical protein